MKKTNFIKLVALIMAMMMALLTICSCADTNTDVNEPVDTKTTESTEEQTNAPVDNSAGSINYVPLDKFVIVHEDKEEISALARTLKNAIQKATGYDLALVADSEDAKVEEAEYEIIVGNVEREVTKSFYENPYKYYNAYNVLVSGKKLAILASNEYTVKSAVDALIDTFFGEGAAPARITDDKSFSGDIYGNKAIAINKRIDDTDIRIAGNNIYFHQKDTSTVADDYEYRKTFLLQNFVLFDADVLMLQECGYDKSLSPTKNTWHDVIDHELEDIGYTYVPADPKTKLYMNYTPIWYNAEKLDLVDCKYHLFDSVKELPDGSISHSKSYTMAVFKDKNSGGQFACISTHFTWAGTEEQATRLKKSDATEIVTEVLAIREKYGKDFPIILMGDLNSTTNSEPYRIVDKELDNVRLMAGVVKKNISYGTTHGLGTLPKQGGGIIDHTMVSGSGYTCKQYHHVINQWSSHSTDHIPLLLDVDFTE